MSITRRYYRTLPRWGKRLSRRFVAAYGKPAGLWLPNDVTNKAYDFSSNRNIGTLNGGVTTTAIDWGTLKAAWKFDGSSGNASIPLVSTAVNNFSFFCLFEPAIGNQNGHIFFNGLVSSNGWGFWHNNGGGGSGSLLTVVADGAAYNAVSSAYTLSAGTKVFGVFSRVAGANTLYINGQVFATGTQAFNAPTGGTFLAAGSAASLFWSGKIWAAGITKPLVDSQVSSLYQSLLTGDPYTLFEPQSRDRFANSASIINRSFFRRTLSQFGTRTGTRQTIG